MSLDSVRLSRTELTLWSGMVRDARASAATENAPVTAATLDALADYLRDALEEPVQRAQAAESTWDADYAASHRPGATERLIESFAAQGRRRAAR